MKRFRFVAIVVLFGLVIASQSIAKTAICDSYESEIKNDEDYRISFGDSGVGGLIFALDVLKDLETQLKTLESEYRVKFIFHHLGDTKNAPYGNKNPEEIKLLTKRFIEYLINLPDVQNLIVACNTASTVYDDKMNRYFRDKYPNVDITTMINYSSEKLYQTTMAANTRLGNEKDSLAIFATPATINSGAYQSRINNITDQDNRRVKIYTYAPKNWVANLEHGADQEKSKAEVLKDLAYFKASIGDKNFADIKTVGLFCTHFPYYYQEMSDFFAKNNSHPIFLTQGAIFSKKIYEEIVNKLKLKSNKAAYRFRKNKIPTKCVEDIKINSDITGDNIDTIKKIVGITHPQYLGQILFKKVTISD